MLMQVLTISMADYITRLMIYRGIPAKFFLVPQLLKVVANVCLKSDGWRGGWIECCFESLSEVCGKR